MSEGGGPPVGAASTSAQPVPTRPFEVTLDAAHRGQRIDRVLADCTPGVSRALLQRWMTEGRVTHDERPVRPSDKVVGAMVLRLVPAPPPPSDAVPQDIPLDVVYEDDHLVVLHKPAGLVVHPAPGHPDGTLVNALRFHVRFPEAFDPTRPGIVHRLDRDTSGVMVVAKSEVARDGLIPQFQAHSIEREYWAIVHGSPALPLTVETLHGRHPHDRKRFTGRVPRGKRAVTHLSSVERLSDATLAACRLETGRTHQIRVHTSEAGFPILADPMYGRPAARGLLKEAAVAAGRLALHARLLAFDHPLSGERMSFERPPPEDFLAALAVLRGDTAPP